MSAPQHIAFLIGDPAVARNDNHIRLPQAFAAAGWQVSQFSHEALSSHNRSVYLEDQPATQYRLIWPIGFGPRQTFADRLQLLSLVDAQLVNRAASYLTHHGKAVLHRWLPETYCANAAHRLSPLLTKAGDWVLKPLAGSYGEGVVRLASGDVKSLTSAFESRPGYYVLQRYQPEIAAGENRTLLAGDTLLGSYRRIPGANLTANLARGGQAAAVELGEQELGLVRQVATELNRAGIRFAAIDTAYPYLVEVNVANPGGLGTLETLYEKPFAAHLVGAFEGGAAGNQ